MKKILKNVIPNPILLFYHKVKVTLCFIKAVYSKKTTDSPFLVASNKFGTYFMPISLLHCCVVRAILDNRVWEEGTILFLMKNCADGDIVHAGAYFGDFLPALSAACSPNAKVWAFEPVSEYYKCSNLTIRLNELNNIKLFNAGLFDRKQSNVKMVTKQHYGACLGGASAIVGNHAQFPPQQVKKFGVYSADALSKKNITFVNTVALDDIIPMDRKVSIIQLDIEGYEEKALQGALKIIRRCHPILVLEEFKVSAWTSQNILSLGYEVIAKVHKNTILKYTAIENSTDTL